MHTSPSLDAITREMAAQDATLAQALGQLAALPSNANIDAALSSELTEHLDRIEAEVARARHAAVTSGEQTAPWAVALLQRA
jgi:hypothetical protein